MQQQLSIPLDHKLEAVIDGVGEVADLLWEKGWAERNAGNISVDVSDYLPRELEGVDRFPLTRLDQSYPHLPGCSILVSGAGTRMRELARRPNENACILRLSATSDSYRTLWGGARETGFVPTSELPVHLGIHEFLRKSGARQRAVVHSHPNELIALTHAAEFCDESSLNRVLPAMHPEVKIAISDGAGLVPYYRPGSGELARETVERLARNRLVVWEKHGCVAVGVDVFQALGLIDTLNKAAQIFLLCKSAGLTPQGLTAAQLQEIEQFLPWPGGEV